MIAYLINSSTGSQRVRAASICSRLDDAVIVFKYNNTPKTLLDLQFGNVLVAEGGDVETLLFDLDPDVFIADSFPYGLALETLLFVSGHRSKKVFINRMNPWMGNQFDCSEWDLVLAVEPGVDGELVWPIMPLDCNDLPTRGESRGGWGVSDDEPLVVVVPSTTHKFPNLVALAGDKARVAKGYPLHYMLVGADLVVSHAGSQIANEVLALGLPHCMVGVPTTEDQHLRENCHPSLVRQFVDEVEVLDRSDDWKPFYVNGAELAASMIARL